MLKVRVASVEENIWESQLKRFWTWEKKTDGIFYKVGKEDQIELGGKLLMT